MQNSEAQKVKTMKNCAVSLRVRDVAVSHLVIRPSDALTDPQAVI